MHGPCAEVHRPDATPEQSKILVRTVDGSLLEIGFQDFDGNVIMLAEMEKIQLPNSEIRGNEDGIPGRLAFDYPEPGPESCRDMMLLQVCLSSYCDEPSVGVIILKQVDIGIFHKVGVLEILCSVADTLIWEERMVVIE